MKKHSKILSVVLIVALLFPRYSFAQGPDPVTQEQKIKFVLHIVKILFEDQDCSNGKHNPYKDFFCKIPIATIKSNEVSQASTDKDTIIDKDGILTSITYIALNVVALAYVAVSYQMEIRSIGHALRPLMPDELQVVSNQTSLTEYIAASAEKRLAACPKCIGLNQILNQSFSEIKVVQETEKVIQYSWKVGEKTLTQKITAANFEIMIKDLGSVNPAKHAEYLSHYAEYAAKSATMGEKFLKGEGLEILTKKNPLLAETATVAEAENLLRKKALRKGFIGIVILIAADLALLTITATSSNAPPVEFTSANLMDMCKRDPHSFKAYILDPNPELVDFYYAFFKAIPNSQAESERIMKSLK